MTYPMCAVILAAGMGVRLEPVFANRPKGFITLAHMPIIERSIQQLRALGIAEIIIVTGYAAADYEALACHYPEIRLVKNPHYAVSGHMYSLYCARDYVQGDFLLLESDLVYEKRALQTLLQFPKPNAILLSGFTHSDDEVFVSTQGERVLKLSKRRADLPQVTGELVGILKISSAMFKAMLRYAEEYFQQDLNLYYEECINGITQTEDVFYCQVEDLIWAEIDTPAHLERVTAKILPQLLQEWGT